MQVSPSDQALCRLHHYVVPSPPQRPDQRKPFSAELWPLLGWEARLRQEATGTGNRAEAGRRSGRDRQDPGPLTPCPTSLQESYMVFPKIFTVSLQSKSKLMRYCISADNGRM